MDSWEKFDETTLPPKEAFYSNLNLEDISDEDYAHAQRVWDVFDLGDYYDLYVQSDNYCLKMYMKSLEILVLKNINSILHILCLHLD